MEKKLSDYLHYYMGCTFWTPNSEGQVNNKTIGYIIDMIDNGTKVQLHLRRLADMTEEDWQKVTSETKLSHDTMAVESLKDSFLKGGFDDRYHWTVTNMALIALRRLGVDVDGLIPAGLAIDAKTLQP